MALAHVETLFHDISGSSFSITPAAGNTVVFVANWDDASITLDSVDDTKGNQWVSCGARATITGNNAHAYIAKGVAAGATTVTLHFSAPIGGLNFADGYSSRYSGTTVSEDQYSKNQNAGTSTPDSGSKTTTHADEIIWGFCGGLGGTIGGGAGFNERETTNNNVVEDKTVAATGSFSAPFTGSITGWVALMVTLFEDTGGGGGGGALAFQSGSMQVQTPGYL